MKGGSGLPLAVGRSRILVVSELLGPPAAPARELYTRFCHVPVRPRDTEREVLGWFTYHDAGAFLHEIQA